MCTCVFLNLFVLEQSFTLMFVKTFKHRSVKFLMLLSQVIMRIKQLDHTTLIVLKVSYTSLMCFLSSLSQSWLRVYFCWSYITRFLQVCHHIDATNIAVPYFRPKRPPLTYGNVKNYNYNDVIDTAIIIIAICYTKRKKVSLQVLVFVSGVYKPIYILENVDFDTHHILSNDTKVLTMKILRYLKGLGYLCQKAETTWSHILLMSVLLQKYLTILLSLICRMTWILNPEVPHCGYTRQWKLGCWLHPKSITVL